VIARIAAIAVWCTAAVFGQVGYRYFYDGNGQLFRALDSNGNLLEYDYDAAGNPTGIARSTVAPASLAILNIVPARGGAGGSVTIYGQNFSSVAAGDTVMFNGVAATVISASATAIVVQVPNGVSTGPVSVTVGGNMVTSGTLDFTVIGLPTITSISPAFGYPGQTETVNVQGTNLTDAGFALVGAGGIGITNVSLTSTTQASFTATVGQVGGAFVLVATNDYGPSSSIAMAANTFEIYEPRGSNYALVQLAVFNTAITAGAEPNVPPGSYAAMQTFSTFNTNSDDTQPNVPPGSYAALQTFSTFNTNSDDTQPNVPPGSYAALQTFATFNTYVPPGQGGGVPKGSNYAYEVFATQNNGSGTAMSSMSPMLSVKPLERTAGGSAGPVLPARGGTLVAGQTVAIDSGSPTVYLPGLQFRVNGVTLATSTSGYLETYFTVPAGMRTLNLQITGQNVSGEEVDSGPAEVSVTPDRGETLAGQAVDPNGKPVAGAEVTWQANGLEADFYRFEHELTEIPDLRGLTPDRTGYVSAINAPNPDAVFGQDPMEVALGRYYAARFHGKLIVSSAGSYQFQLTAATGARLRIDGAPVVESAGEHEIEAIYYESGGAPSVQLLWTPPNGIQEVAPPQAFSTAPSASRTATTAADGSFELVVPRALGGVQVSVVNGRGSIVLGQ